MREPAFWHRPSSWKSHLLRPLGALYGAVAARRLQRKGFDAAGRVVEQLGGALDRTLAALEPYLLQLRLEMGAANA